MLRFSERHFRAPDAIFGHIEGSGRGDSVTARSKSGLDEGHSLILRNQSELYE